MFQFPGQGKPPLGVLFDSDLGNRIDSVLALALLFGLDGKNECRVVAVNTSKPNLKSAALADVITKFYGGTPSGPFSMYARPVGMAETGKDSADTPILVQTLAKQGPDGKPAYKTDVDSLNDTADPAPFIRNTFTAQHDGNCSVVITGPVTNLVRSMQLPGVKDLAANKVRAVILAESATLTSDSASLQKLLAEWPTDVFFVPLSVGKAIEFPGASIEKDFGYVPNHPIADAYKAYKPMPYDTPTTEMAAVMFAVRPALFNASDAGTLSLANASLSLTPASSGKHKIVEMNDANRETIAKAYVELVSAKPVVRAPRFRRVEEQKKLEQKKLEEKKLEGEKKPSP